MLAVFLMFGSFTAISQDTILQKVACLDVIKEYRNFWDNDTLGHAGFRLLVAEKYLKSCDFNGVKWTDLIKVIGKPIRSFSLEDKSTVYHRYIIFKASSEDWATPGNAYLEFDVQNNIIISSHFYYVDG